MTAFVYHPMWVEAPNGAVHFGTIVFNPFGAIAPGTVITDP